MKNEKFLYAVYYEKNLNGKKQITDLTVRKKVFFATRSSAEKWINDVKNFDKHTTLSKFSIKELDSTF